MTRIAADSFFHNFTIFVNCNFFFLIPPIAFFVSFFIIRTSPFFISGAIKINPFASLFFMEVFTYFFHFSGWIKGYIMIRYGIKCYVLLFLLSKIFKRN